MVFSSFGEYVTDVIRPAFFSSGDVNSDPVAIAPGSDRISPVTACDVSAKMDAGDYLRRRVAAFVVYDISPQADSGTMVFCPYPRRKRKPFSMRRVS